MEFPNIFAVTYWMRHILSWKFSRKPWSFMFFVLIQVRSRKLCIHSFSFKTMIGSYSKWRDRRRGWASALGINHVADMCPACQKWWVKFLTKVGTPFHFICRSFSFVAAFQKPSLFKNLFHFANVAPATQICFALCVRVRVCVCLYRI